MRSAHPPPPGEGLAAARPADERAGGRGGSADRRLRGAGLRLGIGALAHRGPQGWDWLRRLSDADWPDLAGGGFGAGAGQCQLPSLRGDAHLVGRAERTLPPVLAAGLCPEPQSARARLALPQAKARLPSLLGRSGGSASGRDHAAGPDRSPVPCPETPSHSTGPQLLSVRLGGWTRQDLLRFRSCPSSSSELVWLQVQKP